MRFCCWIALVVLLLSACMPAPKPEIGLPPVTPLSLATEEEAPFVVPTTAAPETAAPSPTVMPKPTKSVDEPEHPRRREPTATPGPTHVPCPSTSEPYEAPDVSEPLSLAERFSTPQVLANFAGEWSPTANELAGLVFTDRGPTALVVTSGPDFVLDPVLTPEDEFWGDNLIWSPDGRRIVFSWIQWGEEGYPFVMDHNGNNPHLLVDSAFRWLGFPGWMDERRLVVSGYSGGGHNNVAILNVWDERIAAEMVIHGFAFEPSAEYVPANYLMAANNELFLMSPKVQSEERQLTNFLEDPSYSRSYPEPYKNETTYPGPERWQRVFRTWLPGESELVLSQYGLDWDGPCGEQVAQIDLRTWNVDTDEIHFLAPNGVDAEVSPDGRYLAVVTLGQPALKENGTFADDAVLPALDQRQTFLSLMERSSGRVLMYMPVQFPDILSYLEYARADRIPAAAFSPDGRYLAFLTPDFARQDQVDDPLKLVVFDLQEQAFRYSQPAASVVTWSPKSDRFVYQGEDGNWYLYDLAQVEPVAITQRGGRRLVGPTWSFSGSYLSFLLTEDGYDYGMMPGDTYIWDMTH